MEWLTARTSTFGLSGKMLRIVITTVSTIGFSLFGYDQGLMSGIINAENFHDFFPGTERSVIQGAVTSCYELGCFFGALFVLFRGEKIGRRPLIIVGAIIIIIGTVISVTPTRGKWPLGHFVIGRVITGVGNGFNTATIPVWQSELSRAENRGRLVNLEGAIVAVGTLIAYWLDFGLSYTDQSSTLSWRLPVALQILFALILLIGILRLPESPRWLIAQGRHAEADLILGALKAIPPTDDEIVAERTVIQDAVQRSKSKGFSDLLTNGRTQHFQRMVIGASTQFFQQFTGCNAAIYYSTVLFQNNMGFSPKKALLLGGIFATVYALSTIPSFFLVDSLGRRKLFLIGATGQAIAFTITFGCLIKDSTQSAKGAAFGIYLFIFFFAWTILPLPWVYPPEINPLRTRTSAAAVSTCTNWICNFAVVMFTPVFAAKSGWGVYVFFAAVNYLWIPVIYWYYPETAGRSLEEIDIIFAKAHVEKIQPWRAAVALPKLSYKEVEDQIHTLGIYDDDFEKENFEVKDAVSSTDSNAEILGDNEIQEDQKKE
jgi:sugar porter (SP) family MFS transporter